jgi:hypothetical protein
MIAAIKWLVRHLFDLGGTLPAPWPDAIAGSSLVIAYLLIAKWLFARLARLVSKLLHALVKVICAVLILPDTLTTAGRRKRGLAPFAWVYPLGDFVDGLDQRASSTLTKRRTWRPKHTRLAFGLLIIALVVPAGAWFALKSHSETGWQDAARKVVDAYRHVETWAST